MGAADVKQELPIRDDKNRANETDMKTLQERLEDFYGWANETDMKTLQECLEDFYGWSNEIVMKMLQENHEEFYRRWKVPKSFTMPFSLIYSPQKENIACSYNSGLTPSPAASEMEYHISCFAKYLTLHYGSHSAHPGALVSSGHIMKKNSRSGGPVGIQSVEETELAYHVGLAPVSVLANGITKSVRLILSVFKGSGTTSAPATIPRGPLFVIDIDPHWMVDSGASASLTGDRSLLQGLHAADRKGFMVANGEVVWSNSCGRASGRVNLSGIRFVPDCNKNIISATHLVRLGCEVLFDDQGCTIRKNGTLIGKAPGHAFTDGLYYLDFLNDTLLVSICPACPHPGAQGN